MPRKPTRNEKTWAKAFVLTRREKQFVWYIEHNYDPRIVAQELGVLVETAKATLRKVKEKLVIIDIIKKEDALKRHYGFMKLDTARRGTLVDVTNPVLKKQLL